MSEGIELTTAQLREWAGLGRRWGQGRNPVLPHQARPLA